MSYNVGQHAKHCASSEPVRGRSRARMCLRHGYPCSGAKRHAPDHSYRHYGPRGKLCIFGRPCHWSQGYVCLPTSTVALPGHHPARPEATLFADFFGQHVQIITHFPSINANPKRALLAPFPKWQRNMAEFPRYQQGVGDGSGNRCAGTDPASCPNSGSIQCLLLQSVGNQQGPTGGKLLAKSTFIQRLNTKGGSAPTSACTVGQTQLVPYTADYFFFRTDQ